MYGPACTAVSNIERCVLFMDDIIVNMCYFVFISLKSCW